MSQRRAFSPSLRAVPKEAIRSFRLTIVPSEGDAFGITIAESYGYGDGPTVPVLTAAAVQTSRVLDAVLAAVKASGHTPGRLSINRRSPLPIDESAGVRLALTLFTTQPITKHERIRALVAGISAMSVEETYYWYAKCVGVDGSRARKALRILLAEENTGVKY